MALDAQRLLISASIGDAISAWARVEEELSIIFEHALAANNPKSASAVFYSVRSFEARLTMTQASISMLWPPLPTDDQSEWDSLVNLLNRK
jgi:hypothetical protein